jgi:UDP-glucose 4-epimerase
MNVLVTGGTGFVGSHVVDLLAAHGDRVRVLTRDRQGWDRLRDKGIEPFHGDLQDYPSVMEAMDGMEVFYHIGEVRNTTKAAAGKNVALMERILDALSGDSRIRFVFVSSITVAGIPASVPADENTEPEKVLQDHYTGCKRECEQLLAERADETDYVVIRPAPVYGPRSRYLGKLITMIRHLGPLGLPFVGKGENLAPLIQVNDLARAIHLAGTVQGIGGAILNITDGVRHSWSEFFKTIAQCMDRSLRLIPIPPELLKLPALPVDALSGFFGMELHLKDYLDYFSRDIFFDNGRAGDILGWEPEYKDLEKGVDAMVAFYQERGR